MKIIRVLHIIKTLNLGGAETNLFNLVNAIHKDKFECHVAYSYGGAIEKRFQAREGLKLFKYAKGDHKIKSLASVGIITRLVKYILKHKIDIVHTHTFNAHIWGLFAAKITGKKIVEHVHDFRYLEPEDFSKRRGISRQYKYVKYLANKSDAVIVLTTQNKDFLIEKNLYPSQLIKKIPNGMPVDSEAHIVEQMNNDTLLAKLKLNKGQKIILTPARIASEKNIDLILSIALDVIKQDDKAVFLICGDGPLLEQFITQIKALRLESKIRFIGFYPKIEELLTISEVFLLPSFLELHSIAILEALMMKVPVVVSTGVGCNDEFIDNWQNGVLLDPFSEVGWAEAIVKLLKDEQLRKGIGENGYRTCCDKFDVNKTARDLEDIYVQLAAQ